MAPMIFTALGIALFWIIYDRKNNKKNDDSNKNVKS